MIDKKEPPPKHMNQLVDNNTTPNLKIASYFLGILASRDEEIWNPTCGTIPKTIKNGINKHHLRKLEATRLMVNMCNYIEHCDG